MKSPTKRIFYRLRIYFASNSVDCTNCAGQRPTKHLPCSTLPAKKKAVRSIAFFALVIYTPKLTASLYRVRKTGSNNTCSSKCACNGHCIASIWQVRPLLLRSLRLWLWIRIRRWGWCRSYWLIGCSNFRRNNGLVCSIECCRSYRKWNLICIEFITLWRCSFNQVIIAWRQIELISILIDTLSQQICSCSSVLNQRSQLSLCKNISGCKGTVCTSSKPLFNQCAISLV